MDSLILATLFFISFCFSKPTSNFILPLSDSTTDLQQKVKWLQGEVAALRREVASANEYCKIIPETTCGPCQCRDDDRILTRHYCDCQNISPQRDCLDFYRSGYRINGIYKIHQNNIKLLQVSCDMTTDGGGWTVFQRRTDGSLELYRTWEEYEKGFGQFQNEFWLGNKNIFTLTHQGLLPMGNQLRVDLIDWNNVKKYAKYNLFQLGNRQTKYQLHITGYSGDAGDSLGPVHNGQRFSTFDQDNDNNPNGNCAQQNGGWWNNHCESSNLNGIEYRRPGSFVAAKCPHWDGFHGENYSLRFTEMKMRRNI